MLELTTIKDGKDGTLQIADSFRNIPFSIKRVYFIKDLKKESIRGVHAHKKLEQIAFCLKGSFVLRLYNGKRRLKRFVKADGSGAYIPPMIWHSMEGFSRNCLIAVFASDVYDECDYIRDFSEFRRLTK